MSASKIHDRYTDQQIAGFYESGFWQASSLTDLIAAQAEARGDQQFVFDSTTSLTFGELQEASLRLAAGLRRDGITSGDRVAVQLPNWTEFVVLAAALSRLGAITVPIMPLYRGDEVAYVLQHSGAVAAVTCEDFRGFAHLAMFEKMRGSCPDLRQLYVARAAGRDGVRSIDDLMGSTTGVDNAALAAEIGPDSSPDDPFLIVYTSGTTSRPKGCFHTFNTLRSSAAAIQRSLGYDESDVQFGPSPITHSTGLVTSVVLPLLVGARSFLMEAFDPEQGLKDIEQHGCTGAVTATPFLQMLMGAYDPAKHDASSLRFWVCAGSPIPGSVVTSSRELFAGCQTLSLYGRSENFLTTMCTTHDAPERSATSDGRALSGAEVQVVGADGYAVPVGEEGDIAYRGPSHMMGYYRNEEETTALFTPDGFSRSGDLGRMDADGYVRVTGRLKDIVIRGGMNISAREVEDHLLSHPAIAAVAVVGMPDERLGEKVCAYVVPAPGETIDLAAMTAYLREHEVATQKLPERIELVVALPMTATGKVQKHVLRAEVAEKLSQERGTVDA
jgi:acyl-CoA synthetase (AMP-forming)/AMP-acid ligase II